jgi:RimJ/RimL family protein N-acetyltransferase
MKAISANFDFLGSHDAQLVRLGGLAERYFKDDPNTCLIKLRQFGELLAQLTAAKSGLLTSPEEQQADLLRRLKFERVVPREVGDLFHQLRIAGNRATHVHTGDHAEALSTLKIARELGIWFHRTFTDGKYKAGAFVPPPNPADATKALQEELQRLRQALDQTRSDAEKARVAAENEARERLSAQERARKDREERTVWEQLATEAEKAKAALSTQLQTLQATAAQAPAQTMAAIVAKADAAAAEIDIDEASTRTLIDAALRVRGWEVDTQTMRCASGTRPAKGKNMAIAEWPTKSGPADYALFVGTKCIGVVEAKRRNKNVSSHIDQAQRYARGFRFDGGAEPIGGPWLDSASERFFVPFVFSTNGRPYLKQMETESGIWFRDTRKPFNHRRALTDWPTPDGLKGTLEIDAEAAQADLKARPFDFPSPAVAARVFQYMWRYSYDLQALYETPITHTVAEGFAGAKLNRELVEHVRRDGRTSLSQEESRQVLQAYGIATRENATGEGRVYEAKLGSRIDPQFGPILIFGSADRGKDAYGDAVVGLPPLNATLARRMLEQSNFYRAMCSELDPVLLDKLQGLVVRFSELIVEQRWIKEFEINPLAICRGQVMAVDSRCELHGNQVADDELPRPAIRPYPVQYVSTWTMKNGEQLIIRPIRAEDEPLMVKFHHGLSDESVYLRYFQHVKLSARTAHERLARVCFLDYDREIGLLAEYLDPSTKETRVVAIGTLQKLFPKSEGEVAVLVNDDYHRQGLGKELIARLVSFARDEQLRVVSATTMVENDGMCAIFKRLGFELSTDLEDQLVTAKLVLGT